MTRQRQLALLLLGALTLGSCSGRTGGVDSPSPSSGAATPMASKGDNPTIPGGLCSLFTREEIQELYGKAVEPGYVAAPMDSACQWDSPGDSYDLVQIQVIRDPKYWERPSLADGYESLKGIGKEAFVLPEMGGWRAGAVTETAVVMVSIGEAGNRDKAVNILRKVLERLREKS